MLIKVFILGWLEVSVLFYDFIEKLYLKLEYFLWLVIGLNDLDFIYMKIVYK